MPQRAVAPAAAPAAAPARGAPPARGAGVSAAGACAAEWAQEDGGFRSAQQQGRPAGARAAAAPRACGAAAAAAGGGRAAHAAGGAGEEAVSAEARMAQRLRTQAAARRLQAALRGARERRRPELRPMTRVQILLKGRPGLHRGLVCWRGSLADVGGVWLGAPWGVIDSPRDSRHRTTCLPPRAKRSKPRLGSGPLLTDPARSRLASATTVACWGQGSTPIASPRGCRGPPRGGRRARGRACTWCQCVPMHPGGSVRGTRGRTDRTRARAGRRRSLHIRDASRHTRSRSD